jgi:hypothetical protein
MKRHVVLNPGPILFAFALTLMIGGISESRVYAQAPGPCPIDVNSSDPNIAQISQAILDLQAQGASVTCDNTSMYVQFPSGLYFSVSAPDGLPVSMFSFDPVTGRTTYWYITGGIDDSPTLIIQDSVYGFINATDGWFSVFYPIGNPFSAAIQNPMDALMMGTFGYSSDPFGSTDPNSRFQPIQP